MSGTGDLITRVYSNFRGVDFRGEEVNLARSPDSVNMWKDYTKTESVRSRPGLERVVSFYDEDSGSGEKVYGMYFFGDSMIVHADVRLYKIDSKGTKTPLYFTMKKAKSNFFVFADKLYIMDGENYLVYDGETVKSVEPYIPTTSIGRAPNGGGTVHEDVNLLTKWRRNTFAGDGESKFYYLDTKDIPIGEGKYEITVNGVKLKNSQFTISDAKRCVMILEAPPKPDTIGEDNVEIVFEADIEDKSQNIKRCTMMQVFDNRVFASGNPDYPNVLWHCSLYDPSYWSDNDYYEEGLDKARIKSMVAGSDALLVFREPSDSNTTVFYHRPVTDETYGKIYPSVHSGISLGCVGKAVNFNDDIVFFSQRGMEAVMTDKITSEQVLEHRSSLVDRKLISEQGYGDMVLAEWNGYLFVFVNNIVYLADSRAVFTNEDHVEYEWFYWDMGSAFNVTGAIEHDGELYMSTGFYVYKLSISKEANKNCYWTTPKDKFKYPNRLKTTNKRGCVVEAEGSIKMSAKTDNDDKFVNVGEYENIEDFFVGRVKCKKFKDIQLKFESESSFVLESATLEAFVGGYIKR